MNGAQHPIHALPQGYRLQEYELVRVLGFGGFGMTYLGFDHNLNKAVAIKEYLPSDIATRTGNNSVAPQASQFRDDFEWGQERFLDEARALARFDHRNIIKVYRFFEAHSTAYIVMEYAEGETLSAFLERKGVLSESELKAILYPLFEGLEVVHEADFLHRDIKPGNIIIRDEDNSPVLLDFGSARQAMGARSRSVTSIITPGYAPIEQYSSRGDQGPWTDIYALGGVCYRALTGQVPDDATDRVRNDPLIPVVERCEGQASAEFLSAIDWAVAVDEGDRPQSIGVWRTALEEETLRIVSAQPSVTASAPALPSEEEKREAVVSTVGRQRALSERGQKARGKLLAVVISVVAVLIVGIIYIVQAEKQRQELVAEKARIEVEKARLAAEQAEKQRREQAVLEKLRQEEAALEKQRQEQAAEKARLAEKLRQEEAALEKQGQEQAAERARLAEKQRQEQAAERARLAEKQRQEQAEKKEKLKEPVGYGDVRRGFLGVQISDLDPLRAKALGLLNSQGAVIKQVIPGKAADKAGVNVNDIVIAVDGHSVRDVTELISRIGRVRPGTESELSILRNGRKMRIKVVLDALPETVVASNSPLNNLDNIQSGRRFKDCSVCPEMIVVPSGSFTMGSLSSEIGRKDTESPQRRVRFTRPFAVGVYEVTFEEWDACVNAGGCNNSYPIDQGWGRGNRPVINVSWNDVQTYIQWLSERTGKNYRLLSESEWEYVARAGTTTPFHFGATISTDQANYNGNYTYNNGHKGLFRKKTLPVGTLSPNQFGLYDMHGNVIEWTQDCWNDSYQRISRSGATREYGDCDFRVLRGGSWYNEPRFLRSANRGRSTLKIRNSYIGFRVARTF